MKTSVLFISPAILFLLSQAALLCAAAPAAASSAALVLDADGKPVRSGVKYYVVPVTSKNGGGGLDLASTGKKKCPKAVVQVANPKLPGQAVAFYPVNPKHAVVRNGTDLNVEFPDAANECPKSSNFWSLTGDPESTDMRHFVGSGGEKGRPEVYGNTRNWFQILRAGKGYKFNFCPDAVCGCNPVCQDVGITVEKGKRLLELGTAFNSKYSLEVNFKRAHKK